MEVRILGGVEARDDGRGAVDLGPPKQRAVLGILALEAGRVVPAERLIDLLWGDESPKADASLRAYVSNLRRALEPDRKPRDEPTVLLTQPPGYRLAVDRSQVDALRFEDLVAAGRHDDALALWAGPPLPELDGDPVQVEAASRLAAVRAEALEGAAAARLDRGDAAGAARLLEPELADHPLRERMHALAALAQYRTGRQADALRTISQARTNLGEIAGLDPGPELRQLESDVLAQSPSLAGPAPEAPPQPAAPAAAAPATTLVGRDAELRTLIEVLDAALAGRGTTAVLVGEPGIGKTRLAEELAEVARTRGAAVAWVRCPESGAVPAYWPAMQLGAQLREAGVFDAALPAAFSGDEPPPTATSQFSLHELVVGVLVGQQRPVVLVVDDLQWADPDSLRLLAHGAGRLGTAPLLLLATVRPLDDRSPDALVDALAEMARAEGSVRLQLGGLDAAAVADYLHQRRDDVPAEVAAVVHDRTGGNPLFVKELAELLASEGRLADAAQRALPPGVQFVVRRRVAHLPPPTQQLLTVAAVVGRTFDADVVAAVVDHPVDEVLDDLSPALDAGLVAGDGSSSFSFSHALVADALAAEVNAARRARFHAAAARALVHAGADDVEVAHHALEGAAAGTAELAFEASTRAAHQAAARFAVEDAAGHWARAVKALDRIRRADRLPTLLELAAAQFRADLVIQAKATCITIIESGDVEAMGRAVTLLDVPTLWPTQGYGDVDRPVVAAIERALGRLPEGPDRVHALAALASNLVYGERDRAVAVARDAVEAARRLGDDEVLGHALVALFKARWGPSTLEDRRGLGGELEALVDRGLSDDLAVGALSCRAIVAYEDADLDGCEALLLRAMGHADRTGAAAHVSQLGWWLAGLRIHRGRYDEARRLADRADETYRRTRRVDAEIIAYAARFAIAADVGGYDEIFTHLPDLGEQAGAYTPLFLETAAWAMLEDGQPDVAAAFVAGGLPPATDDYTTMLADCLALEVRAQLGDVDGCRVLLARTAHLEDRWIAPGSGVLSIGVGALPLAIGRAAVGDDAEARRLFAKAIAAHERLGTPAQLARSLAHAGLQTGDAELLARARAIAEEHGFAYVLRRLQQAANSAAT